MSLGVVKDPRGVQQGRLESWNSVHSVLARGHMLSTVKNTEMKDLAPYLSRIISSYGQMEIELPYQAQSRLEGKIYSGRWIWEDFLEEVVFLTEVYGVKTLFSGRDGGPG